MIFENHNPLEGKVFQILDKTGKVVNENYYKDIDSNLLLKMYRCMVLSRIQDEWALKFQRQGRMLTFAPTLGQEGLQVASMAACREDDWLVPAFRSNAAWLYKGLPMKNIFLYWCGNEMGSKIPDHINMLPIVVPIGTQFNHATGVGMSFRYTKEDKVVVTYIGDGGTSEGEFYEGINFAGVMNAPVIFIIQNNQFAISTSVESQTKAKTLAQKGIAAGIPSIKVDGNDIFAMYFATKEAVENARSGNGPSLIEAVTYRQGPHTTADDPTIYRTEEKHLDGMSKDPIIRTKNFLIEKGILTEKDEEKIREESKKTVFEEFEKAEQENITPLEDIFKYTYKEMTDNLKEQYEEAKKLEGGKN